MTFHNVLMYNFVALPNTGDSHYTRFRFPRFRISAVLFQHYEKHQYPIRGQLLKPITCTELPPGLSGNVMQLISLASKNYGASLISKCRLLYVSRFMSFRYTRRFLGTLPPCITRVTCMFAFDGLFRGSVHN
jgi:hypothetical protein